MRLVTWNCRRGPYRIKARALEKLRFDIAVMPESPRPATESESALWVGVQPNRGLLVVASPAWRLRPIAMRGLAKFFVPIEVSGPEKFLLLAIWAQQNTRRTRYVLGVMRAIKRCATMIQSQPTVLLGDFNSNTFWDGNYPSNANHTALVERLHKLGCVSAYHHFYGEEHGSESRPTYFQYNHRDKPYHLDYCFVPRAWAPRIRRIVVGTHDQWRRWSDHRPVVVDLSDVGSATSDASYRTTTDRTP